MQTPKQKKALIEKYNELINQIQQFLNSQPENLVYSPECEAMAQAQAGFSAARQALIRRIAC